MKTHENILDLLREKGAEAARNMLRALIIQPGAIGDCILTLPLAAFVKDKLNLGGIDILGHTEYVGFLPGRSCIDGVRSIDALELNRLFAESEAFELTDRDSLIGAFSDYSWIITFLGGQESNFEQNLIYTANCSHSAEVITVPAKPHQDNLEHVSAFYIRQFVELAGLSGQFRECKTDASLIKANAADGAGARELLSEAGLDNRQKLVVIQPGSGGKEKCWYVGNFLAVAAGLASKGFEVVFLLGPAERERLSNATIGRINSVAPCLTDLSLTDVVGLLSCAEAFVGNDSGITHLAGALGVRTAAVFGPTEPAVYKPLGPCVSVFTADTANFAQKSSKALQQEILYTLAA
jgi:hypothetical protein